MPSKSPGEFRVKREEETCQITACGQNVAGEAAFCSGKNSAKKHQFSYEFERKKTSTFTSADPIFGRLLSPRGGGGHVQKTVQKSIFVCCGEQRGGKEGLLAMK